MADDSAGLQSVYLANRDKLLRFLTAQGAGDAAEDALHELWLRVSGERSGPIAAPLSYLYRAAHTLMIDRHRAQRQANLRDRAWSDVAGAAVPGMSDAPDGERVLIARQEAARATAAIDAVGPRAAAIFRRHRIDGLPQKQVAAEFGVSLGTVESDLRAAYRALIEHKRRSDEG